MKADVLVQEIHDAIDIAEDLLLKEAQSRIGTTQIADKSHVDLMIELGFTNADIVKKTQEKEEELVKNQQIAERVLYYKRTYPFTKFLTVPQLDSICDKYTLIYAPVGRYMKNVPKKNLKEIANAQKLNAEDKAEEYWVVTEGTTFYHDVPKATQEWVLKQRFTARPRNSDLRTLLPAKLQKKGSPSYIMDHEETEQVLQNGLFIAAPKSHFNLTGLSEKGKGFFQTIIKKEPKDPIVFRYVNGGIQVLSKWGLEADDPMLANGIDN